MNLREPITLSRACEAIEIPSGIRNTIPAGSTVRVMQSLGTSYTVATDRGYMFRIDAKDRDALGISPGAATDEFAVKGTFSEQLIKDELRTVFDPEIPVNVLDLGLIYSCAITPLQEGGKRLELKMSMTAPGCGMGNVLKADVENKLSRLPEVKEVHVEIVFDPPWHPGFMSESAKLQLGFDLDAGQNEPGPSVFR
ncbi:MAG: putative Fe-S cluster assembly protein SufT [Acidobacteria bacterium]|nr:MAG: putative Fe-S cluster assembly protein SufT [Acidobacteriota bacterium]